MFLRAVFAVCLFLFSPPANAQTQLFSGAPLSVPVVQRTCNFLTGVVTNGSGPCVSPVATCDGVANDTSAAVSFRTWFLANQDATGVIQTVLYIPSGSNCQLAFASNQIAWVQGAKNLLVSAYGSTITNASLTQPILWGGKGQIQDNLHTVRVQTVSAGASCVSFVTSPTPSITGVANSAGTAAFTASIAPIDFATSTLTVTAVSAGTLAVGQIIQDSGGSFGQAISIIAQLTGSAGGIGTYSINASRTVFSTAMTATGVMRLTVSSASGITSGDTIFISGVTGGGNIAFAANGLKWIKVVDGTHIDLFQTAWVASYSYTSGGAIGGDRTSLFTVGQYAFMAGFATQTYWAKPYGFPSNPHYFEYVKVASINSGAQQVCFDAPLTHDYKSTWPQMNTGNVTSTTGGEVDPGGPATLYALDPTWDTAVEYAGLTISDVNNQGTAKGRSITFRDATILGANCMAPSENLLWQAINSDLSSCNVEMDKNITLFKVSGGTVGHWKFQSSSTAEAQITDHTVLVDISGAPKKFTGLRITAPTLTPGAFAYGRSDEWSCTSCVITSGITQGGITQQADNAAHTIWDMSAGIIRIPNTTSYDPCCPQSETQFRVFVPGTNLVWRGALAAARLFQVTDVTQDLDYTYIHTSEAGGFTSAFYSGGTLQVSTHPAPQFTCAGCTGSRDALAYAQCTPAAPLFSCYSATFTGGATGTTTATRFVMWGNFVSATFMVPTPYTGAGALTWKLSQFDNWSVFNASNAVIQYGSAVGGGPTINAKTSGTRQILSTTTSGGVAGDVLNAPGSTTVWFGGQTNNGSVFSANTPSDSPQVTVQMLTNQGVVIPYAMEADKWGWLVGANDNKPRRQSVIPGADNDNVPWRQAM